MYVYVCVCVCVCVFVCVCKFTDYKIYLRQAPIPSQGVAPRSSRQGVALSLFFFITIFASLSLFCTPVARISITLFSYTDYIIIHIHLYISTLENLHAIVGNVSSSFDA